MEVKAVIRQLLTLIFAIMIHDEEALTILVTERESEKVLLKAKQLPLEALYFNLAVISCSQPVDVINQIVSRFP